MSLTHIISGLEGEAYVNYGRLGSAMSEAKDDKPASTQLRQRIL